MRFLVALILIFPALGQVRIRGRVAEPRLHGATTFVRLVARSGMGATWNAAAGSDGSFQLSDVAAGSYYLAAERVSGFPADSKTPPVVGSLHTDAVVVRALDVGDQNLDGVQLEMAPLRDVHGTMRTEDGAVCPLAHGVDVLTRVLLLPEVHILTSLRESQLAESFTVNDVPPVRNRVTVSYAGNCYVKSIAYGGKVADDSVVDLASDGSLDITFALGGRVSGTVVDEGGRVPGRAMITLIPVSGDSTRVRTTWMDGRGGFQFRGVEPGAYHAFAWESGQERLPAPEVWKTFAERASAVTVSKGSGETLRLTGIRLAVKDQ